MKKMLMLIVAVLTLPAVPSPVLAHEVTYQGTVVKYEVARYAQPSGTPREVHELHVTVVDAKSKKPATRVFVIVPTTRLLRGQQAMTRADLPDVKAGETVAVTIDHDKPGDEAITVRLGARQAPGN
jgi:hypothetical protein